MKTTSKVKKVHLNKILLLTIKVKVLINKIILFIKLT